MTLPTETAHPELEGLGKYEYGWADSDTAGASALAAYICGPEGQAVLGRHGFLPPPDLGL